MDKPVINWKGSTLAREFVLPNLAPIQGNAFYFSPLLTRWGFTSLWGWITSDRAFQVYFFNLDRANNFGPVIVLPSAINPFTGFNEVALANVALVGNTFEIGIFNLSPLAMTYIHHYMEVRP